MRTINPRRLIILGGVLAVSGVVLRLLVPALLAPLMYEQVSSGNGLYELTHVEYSGVYVIISNILTALQQVLVPSGAALIGAGLVMQYIDQRARLAILEPLDQSDVEA